MLNNSVELLSMNHRDINYNIDTMAMVGWFLAWRIISMVDRPTQIKKLRWEKKEDPTFLFWEKKLEDQMFF